MKAMHLRFEAGRATPLQWLAGRTGGLAGGFGAALCLAAAGLLAAQAWQLAQAGQELAAVEGELQAHVQLQSVAVAPTAVLQPEQRRAWNQLVAELNAPWAAVLGGLEAATPEDVALVSIEPDARRASVRVQAEAKTLDALLAYAQALRGAEPFGEVGVLKHETNEQDPNHPVRVTLQLWLRDPGDARGAVP